jgi:hypothetical protein
MSRQILNGWKQISNHIERGVRTAQRWEALLGMPVHRPALKDRSAVVAFSDELEHWLSRTSPAALDNCVAIRDHEESNQSLVRALDNMSTLVQQSWRLISRMRFLEERLRRLRKIRHHRIASRTRVHAVSTPARASGSVLFFPRRKRSLLAESTVSAGHPLGADRATLDKARYQR